MTTFDSKGRMRSHFSPPTDEQGKPLSHMDYIRRKGLAVAEKHGVQYAIDWLGRYRTNGPTDSEPFMKAMQAAIDAVAALRQSDEHGPKK